MWWTLRFFWFIIIIPYSRRKWKSFRKIQEEKMKINELHDHIRKRYTRLDEKSASPAGYLLDYADKNGHTLIPTPEECEKSFPNPLGWGVSIENGVSLRGTLFADRGFSRR